MSVFCCTRIFESRCGLIGVDRYFVEELSICLIVNHGRVISLDMTLIGKMNINEINLLFIANKKDSINFSNKIFPKPGKFIFILFSKYYVVPTRSFC